MKTIIIIFAAILMVSCKKKEDVKPTEHLTIECYSKSKKANVNFKGEITSFTNNNVTLEYEVYDSQKEFSITLKNTSIVTNDSLSIKVTYNGITKQKGVKIVGFYSNLVYQLTEFK